MEILNELGGLLLGAVPTVILFVVVIVAYQVLVRGPLERTLAERRLRTSGAMEQAKGAIAAAEAETASYEAKLRAARAEILAMRDASRKQWQANREAALNEARQIAMERVRVAKLEIETSAGVAREQIASAVSTLGESILHAILPAGSNTLPEVRQ
jgi:F-type H+-transporting ATPase subunit b